MEIPSKHIDIKLSAHRVGILVCRYGFFSQVMPVGVLNIVLSESYPLCCIVTSEAYCTLSSCSTLSKAIYMLFVLRF